jgi:hypothetical protein
MTIYFFDSRDDDHFIADNQGLEFETLGQAKEQAAIALAEMAVDVVAGALRRILTIEVRDSFGPVLETRLVFEVLALRPGVLGLDAALRQ